MAVRQTTGSVVSSLLTLSTAAVKTDTVAVLPSKNKKLIILDAGHGGDDPGAIGPNGTKEKDVNLAIVYELKKLFEEDGEYNVLLTRTDDTFVPLVDRTEFANKKRANMFIAVHCNANMDRNTKGFEIYFLSENASDSDAAATAVLENSVVRLEGKPNKQRAKIQELLWSMTVNEFINDSAELCSMIAGEVPRRAKIENKGVKQAGFFVLRGASMPAVLVECAFLSNYGEEAKLRTKRVQANMADSIFEGVKKYYLRKETVNAKR
jgi:N-acetylmuramoyl-L-alanine amidase